MPWAAQFGKREIFCIYLVLEVGGGEGKFKLAPLTKELDPALMFDVP